MLSVPVRTRKNLSFHIPRCTLNFIINVLHIWQNGKTVNVIKIGDKSIIMLFFWMIRECIAMNMNEGVPTFISTEEKSFVCVWCLLFCCVFFSSFSSFYYYYFTFSCFFYYCYYYALHLLIHTHKHMYVPVLHIYIHIVVLLK